MSADKNYKHLEKEILQPYTYIHSQPSKGFRRKIPEAFNHWLRVTQEKLDLVLDIVTSLHDLTLIYDDALDSTTTRRGVPSAHVVYGPARTLSSVPVVVMLLLKNSFTLHPEAPRIICEQLLEATTGHAREIYWRETLICPSEAEYQIMMEQKTGAIFQLTVSLMQLFSDNKEDYSELLKMLGSYFQLRDDYCNIIEPEKLEEFPDVKGVNEYYMDLTEGKFTLPIIHAVNNETDGVVLSNYQYIPHITSVWVPFPKTKTDDSTQDTFDDDLLKQRPSDILTKRHCITRLQDLGSLEYTRKSMADLEREIRHEITRFGGNSSLEKILDKLSIKY